jgi:hypothetical protein
MGLAALDILAIEAPVKRNGRVEALQRLVGLFLETATPSFLGHMLSSAKGNL